MSDTNNFIKVKCKLQYAFDEYKKVFFELQQTSELKPYVDRAIPIGQKLYFTTSTDVFRKVLTRQYSIDNAVLIEKTYHLCQITYPKIVKKLCSAISIAHELINTYDSSRINIYDDSCKDMLFEISEIYSILNYIQQYYLPAIDTK